LIDGDSRLQRESLWRVDRVPLPRSTGGSQHGAPATRGPSATADPPVFSSPWIFRERGARTMRAGSSRRTRSSRAAQMGTPQPGLIPQLARTQAITDSCSWATGRSLPVTFSYARIVPDVSWIIRARCSPPVSANLPEHAPAMALARIMHEKSVMNSPGQENFDCARMKHRTSLKHFGADASRNS